MKKSKRCVVRAGAVLAVLLTVYVGASIWASYHLLVTASYEVVSGRAEGEVRMVIFSDLHGARFGEQNEELTAKVKEQAPDMILMDGDILDSSSGDAEAVCALIEELSKAAPVYYALGNQEESYMEGHVGLTEELESAGAKILDKEYVDLDIRGTALRLGGMYDYAFGLNGKDEADAAPEDVKAFLEEYQDTDRVKIMLAHRPDSFVFGDAAKTWNVDLVISGHTHGGQVVLPFFGGIFGGDQGCFPKYVHGSYKKDNILLLVTSGLGSGKQALPRFRNLPEIVTPTLKKK